MDEAEIFGIADRFRGGPSATAIVCPEVLYSNQPILCVVRKNHVWQFLCGRDHSGDHVHADAGDPRVTTIKEIVARDPSVAPLASMNDRHILRRSRIGAPWVPNDDRSFWWF